MAAIQVLGERGIFPQQLLFVEIITTLVDLLTRQKRVRNLEKEYAQNQTWKVNNKDKVAAHNKTYDEKHHDEIVHKVHLYREENKEHINAKQREKWMLKKEQGCN